MPDYYSHSDLPEWAQRIGVVIVLAAVILFNLFVVLPLLKVLFYG